MKKFLKILALCLMVPMVFAVFSGCELGTPGYSYTLNEDEKSYSVTGYGAFPGVELNLKIPSRHNGKPVTKIAAGAFDNMEYLISVKIPKSIKEIGPGAFSGNERLKKVVLSSNITEIKPSTFKGCKALEEITIPKKVTKIGEEAFDGCSNLTNFTIPKTVVEIEINAFEHDIKNFNYTIDGGIIYYGTNANPYMIAAKNIEGSNNVTVKEGCVALDDNCFWYNREYISNVTLPTTLRQIGEEAFYACNKLEAIKIPDLVEEILTRTFSSCTSLKKVEFGQNLKVIKYSAFKFTKNIEEIVFKNPTGWYYDSTGTYDPRVERIDSSLLSNPTNAASVFYNYFPGDYDYSIDYYCLTKTPSQL